MSYLKSLCLLLLTAGLCRGATIETDGSPADTNPGTNGGDPGVQWALNNAANGDTVYIGHIGATETFTWDKGVTMPGNKNLTLRGNSNVSSGPPATAATATDRTIVIDNVASRTVAATLVKAGSSTGFLHDVCNITFKSGTPTGTSSTAGVVSFGGQDQAVRVHHCHFDKLYNNNVIQISGGAIGLVDNNRIDIRCSLAIIHFDNGKNWHGATDGMGYESWHDDAHWGEAGAGAFFEDNTSIADCNNSATAGCTDGTWGGRQIVRYNFIQNGVVSNHGTEGSNPSGTRGERLVESYNNQFNRTAGNVFEPGGSFRSGNAYIHDNQWTGVVPNASHVARYVIYRNFVSFSPWGPVTGFNPWDKNDPTDPKVTGIITSVTGTPKNGSPFIVDLTVNTGPAWTTADLWKGYQLNYGSSLQSGIRIATSSVAPTHRVTLDNYSDNPASPLPVAGQSFRIAKPLRVLDQPGDGKGELMKISASGAPTVPTLGGVKAYPNPVVEKSYQWNNTQRPTWNGTPNTNWTAQFITQQSPTIGVGSGKDLINASPPAGTYTPYTHPHPRSTLTPGGPASPIFTSVNHATFTTTLTPNCTTGVNCFKIITANNTNGTISKTGTALPSAVTLDSDAGDGTAILSGIPAAGTETSSPYNFTLTTAAGTVTQPFVLTVNNGQPFPTCTLDSPDNGASFTAGATIPIRVTASSVAPGSIANVKFYDGPTLLFTDLTLAYGYDYVTSVLGNHSLEAVATDNLGQTTTSNAAVVTVVGPTATPTPTPPSILVK